ncbi:MAG TPA: DUF4336 domain-containing protein [Geminicoccus sp.]|jgi:hypothetical protein|uniref:DUF4336 domain-containing protein n=1 Tax=Geminicoccus sp. TaxID=2024832 RepID=UPI002E3813A0|nr:DUF4336 domain-containing protein [Geminicoccus sp.]HEX2529728.1 DUF4336 domain-containing protein [Geminicoccus sp.]
MPADHDVTYPPLDVAKPVAPGVWIVDSGPHRMLGLPMPVRMTVIRLANGDLLLHSPTRFDDGLRRQLQELGPIRHLVAPNIAHWSFLKQWQDACPDAVTWAAPGLRERSQVQKSGLRIDRELSAVAPADWAQEIEQLVIPGGGGFTEIAFFHRPTRTLVLTDLVVNVEPQKLPWWMRPGAHLVGATAPDGKAPAYLRMLVKMKRSEAAPAAERLIAMEPERVIFTHGRWFDQEATAQLRRSLAWLTG